MMTPASPAETADAIRLTALAVCTFFEGGAAVRCAVAAAAWGRGAAAPGAGGAGRAGAGLGSGAPCVIGAPHPVQTTSVGEI